MLRTRAVRLALAVTTAAALAVGVIGVTAAGAQTGRRFSIRLSGAAEAPTNAHGDLDHGSVVIWLNQGAGEVCWQFGELTLTAGEPLPFAAHIHEAPVGEPGPIVVTLFDPTTGTTPTSYPTDTVCVSADPALIKEIRKNPQDYYVNMHNDTHPTGVVRGQLG
jgi:hypothetical protein